MPTQVTACSDQELLSRMGSGGEDALAELYDRYGRIAYGLARRVLRDWALAEDAVQEGFLAAWRSAGNYRADAGKPSAWILALVHRRAVDLVRRQVRQRSNPLETAPQLVGRGTEEEVEIRTKRELVQQALGKLTHDQRETLELAYYGGLTQSEVAERLGQPLGTVKSRTFAALRCLRDHLADAEFGPAIAMVPRSATLPDARRERRLPATTELVYRDAS